MALTSKITAFNPAWSNMFEKERGRISGAFGDTLVSIYHVGSTAITGLAAKPEIDMLVEVSSQQRTSEVDNVMRSLGYSRGKDLSPEHYFYRRDVDGVRTHKVHVCPTGHSQISRMLRFRDLLRQDAELKDQYQCLKLKLEAENTDGIKEYLAGKAPFIDAILEAKPDSSN
ncbi:GrpB family protein [Pseudovibrio sp. Alg231-02]|uniref:GrpB family protein n=1 Tax=Pseudovibrio sp. Alg231-02 TaxID=1922223 RepID=UPI000D551047|nr:GrpB family protein [Pseudovibrio sp. Alg231-02]